jgi:hypothetical protein
VTQPAATPSPRPSGQRTGGTTRFAGCKEAMANGYGPYTKGIHPEYYWYVDADHDGVACDPDDLRLSNPT